MSSSIKQAVREEMKQAMRERDQQRLDVLRQVETEISKAKAAPGFRGEVDDALYLEVIAAYVKRMKKALDEYRQLGERAREMVEKLTFEVDYLARWLPQKLDEAATRALVRNAITELGLSGPQATGRVIGHLMKTRKGELDGKLVNKIVREELG